MYRSRCASAAMAAPVTILVFLLAASIHATSIGTNEVTDMTHLETGTRV